MGMKTKNCSHYSRPFRAKIDSRRPNINLPRISNFRNWKSALIDRIFRCGEPVRTFHRSSGYIVTTQSAAQCWGADFGMTMNRTDTILVDFGAFRARSGGSTAHLWRARACKAPGILQRHKFVTRLVIQPVFAVCSPGAQ